MSKHTPGPWNLSDNGFGIYGPEPDEWCIANLCLYGNQGRDGGIVDEEQKANACLIMAAPRLLDSLETAVRWLRRLEREYPGCLNEDAIDKHLMRAIKEAKGE